MFVKQTSSLLTSYPIIISAPAKSLLSISFPRKAPCHSVGKKGGGDSKKLSVGMLATEKLPCYS